MQNMLRFDLLCEVNCRPQRLSFIEGRHQHPIGIFPFKGDSTYFELEETEETLNFDEEISSMEEQCTCVAKLAEEAARIAGVAELEEEAGNEVLGENEDIADIYKIAAKASL